MSTTIKRLVPGTSISFCYAADYNGPDKWEIVSQNHPIARAEPRYTITNGTVTVPGVRIKEMYDASTSVTSNNS